MGPCKKWVRVAQICMGTHTKPRYGVSSLAFRTFSPSPRHQLANTPHRDWGRVQSPWHPERNPLGGSPTRLQRRISALTKKKCPESREFRICGRADPQHAGKKYSWESRDRVAPGRARTVLGTKVGPDIWLLGVSAAEARRESRARHLDFGQT